MSDRPLVARIIAWLRAGYPQGVPDHDYVPLLAILRRQLSEDEVEHVSGELINEAAPPPEAISRIDAGVKISAVTQELPHEADLARVQQYLEEHGFPFDNSPLNPPSAGPSSDAPPSPSDEPSPDGRGARSDSDEPFPDGRGARSASDEPSPDGRGARSDSDEPRDPPTPDEDQP
ncbi:DUF3349 domain-containing protein [Gordonia polyisoprenivorans]|uniref:DUF3349 domain-containing protein n=1 Tax=Gordonia polyisoprenivorans TaxID=84595 RepID=UPI000B99DB41|nr:DUF3349 domain-containing protein [Gordonia polyisoprenivorans]OZC29149.1 hypothetical protein CJJ17_25435 [Gordonia polyisoprenivorans]